MKNSLLAAMLSLAFIGTSCLENSSPGPELIIDPPADQLISRDTISAGEYLRIGVGASAQAVYTTLQELEGTIGLQYINVVGEGGSDINQAGNRIPLYQSIFLDERRGTDTGVQIAFEAGQVNSIYLNSGKQLDQWPLKENASTSVRIGDKVEVLKDKLIKIRSKNSYANKFERISLFTKILSKPYDPVMTDSPQWYFRYMVEQNVYEHVQIHLEQGEVKFVSVSRYKVSS